MYLIALALAVLAIVFYLKNFFELIKLGNQGFIGTIGVSLHDEINKVLNSAWLAITTQPVSMKFFVYQRVNGYQVF